MKLEKKSYLNYTQFVSGVRRSQRFGSVSPGRHRSDTQNMTDPASENRFGWFLTRVFMVLPYIAYTLRGCAAGQGMVYHLSVPKGI